MLVLAQRCCPLVAYIGSGMSLKLLMSPPLSGISQEETWLVKSHDLVEQNLLQSLSQSVPISKLRSDNVLSECASFMWKKEV